MDNNKLKHEQFWRAGERYKTAREAVINCSQLKEFNVAAFSRKLKANFRYAPSEPSVRLFIKADKPMSIQAKEAPFNQQPHYISMCMVTLHETMTDVAMEDDINALHVANVNRLVSELVEAGLDGIERITRQVTTHFSENSDSLRTVENMKICIRGIRAPRIEERHKNPPYPESSPKCPVTSMVPYVNDSNVLIKDESGNPTGTHKDRWAFEQLLHYKSELMDQIRGRDDKELVDFSKLSLISAGNAAYALQYIFRLHNLPSLRVVIDSQRTSERQLIALQSIGAKIFHAKLDEKFLTATDVLGLTQNPNGRDLTTRDPKDPFKLNFYDWLCVEIFAQEYWNLNQFDREKAAQYEGPKHIYVPFGSGDLFCNLIGFIESEAKRSRFEHDEKLKYLLGNHELPFKNIGVYGATSSNPKTPMKKLYSAHRPMLKQINDKVDALVSEGILAPGSGIYDLEDQYINQAMAEASHPEQRLNTEYSGIAGLGLYLKAKNNREDLHRMYLNDSGEPELRQHNHIQAQGSGRVVVVNTGLFYEPDYMSVDI